MRRAFAFLLVRWRLIASPTFKFKNAPALKILRLLLTWPMAMPQSKQTAKDTAAELARLLPDTLQRERLVPRFVDSYVVEHGRYCLQVHAALYRDLLALLHREALLAMSALTIELAARGSDAPASPKSKKPRTMSMAEAAAFRRAFLAALTRQQKWNMADALDFQRDLQMYQELAARSASTRRRKPFEAANHPFVDRCAFLLDSSFLEKARVAASQALNDLEHLTAQVANSVLQTGPSADRNSNSKRNTNRDPGG